MTHTKGQPSFTKNKLNCGWVYNDSDTSFRTEWKYYNILPEQVEASD